MDALQKMVWNLIVGPLWLQRNDILHRQKNNFDAVEEEWMAERLVWYSLHKYDILDGYDQFLARFDAAQISAMSRVAKQEWIKHLDVARAAYQRQICHRANNQRVITEFITARPRTKSSGADGTTESS
jgi:hypothetical protein